MSSESEPMWVLLLRVLPPIFGQLVVLAPLETMFKIREQKTTGDLPLVPYVSMFICGLLWLSYGFLVGQTTIWIANVLPAVLGAYYWFTFLRFAPASFNNRPYTQTAVVVVVAIAATVISSPAQTAAWLIGLVGNVFVVIMFAGPLAAIRTVLREKNTAALPFGMSIASFANCLVWFLFGYLVIQDINIWFGNLLGLIASTIQLGLFAQFGLPPPTGAAAAKREDIDMEETETLL